MLENLTVFHSSIRIVGSKIIYFDPFKIEKNYKDADIIFITHDHFDHYSPDDINKVIKEGTIIVAPSTMISKINYDNIVSVEPQKEYSIDGISFSTVWSYNVNKKFHPKENCWVGYNVELDGIKYYVAGDTDITKEAENVKCDVSGKRYITERKDHNDRFQ